MGDHTDDGDGTGSARRARRPQRTHRGRTVEERRAERRAALRDAGLELFGTVGLVGTSITEVCRTSGVTTRYFYEEYGSLEALLLDVFEAQLGALVAATTGLVIAPGPNRASRELRERSNAFIEGVTADERVARVVLLESASPELEERRRRARRILADFMADTSIALIEVPEPAADDLRLMSLFFVGAVEGAVVDWVLTPAAERVERHHIVDTLVRIFELVRVGYRA